MALQLRQQVLLVVCFAALVANTFLTRSPFTVRVLSDVYVRRLSESTAAAADEASPNDERPVMHTFYHQIDPKKIGRKNKGTGMSDEADMAMIEAWERAWTAAGWKTKVLDLETAKRHPRFEHFNASISDGTMPFGYYDQLCFLRWLAMAAVGGGWMSDYDTFPLNPVPGGGHVLPNNGKLTAYEPLIDNGAVPSLVSGTHKEWNRIAYALFENALEHKEEKFWSDFYALIDLDVTSPGSYEIQDAVIPGRKVLTGRKWTIEHCKWVEGKFAVHFAHDAIIRGHLREGETMEDRVAIAQRWLKMWAERCHALSKE